MSVTTIKKLHVGDIFQIRPDGRLYVRDAYNRSTRMYEFYDYDDVNRFHECKGSFKVLVD